MKLGFTLIVIAAIAGLVGSIAPIDGVSLLPLVLEHALPRGLALAVGFGAPLAIGLFAFAKARMSKPLAIGSLAGFAAAGIATEIWLLLKSLGDNLPVGGLLIAGGVVLGIVGSLIAIIKGVED